MEKSNVTPSLDALQTADAIGLALLFLHRCSDSSPYPPPRELEPGGTLPMRFPVNFNAAVYAGIVAGILATVVQVALWSVFADALPTILFRDARFAAAIVMGRKVLPPPASFDWTVMLIATGVHFALSIAYGLTLAALISRLRTLPSMFAGAVFGLCLYGINMYGFTAVFPWFQAARDSITLVTHAAFGVAAAGVYKMLSRRLVRGRRETYNI